MSTMKDEERKKLVAELTKSIPQELIEDIVNKALDNALRSLTWGDDVVVKLVNDAVINKAKELLKTKYAPSIEEKAHMLAAKVASELPNFSLKPKQNY